MTRALTLANMPGSIQDFLFVLIREKYGPQVAESVKFNKLKQDVWIGNADVVLLCCFAIIIIVIMFNRMKVSVRCLVCGARALKTISSSLDATSIGSCI